MHPGVGHLYSHFHCAAPPHVQSYAHPGIVAGYVHEMPTVAHEPSPGSEGGQPGGGEASATGQLGSSLHTHWPPEHEHPPQAVGQ
jgi:hypothetical protein